MPERAQHIPPPPPLDEQVDQLLADTAANDEAVQDADATAVVQEGADFASPEDLLSDVNASMETLHAQAESAAEAEVDQLAAAVEAVPAVEEGVAARTEDPDFASPATIQQLDEKLAASAQELSDRAAEQDRAIEPVEPVSNAAQVDAAALAADTQADAEVGANVQIAPAEPEANASDSTASSAPVVAPAAAQPAPQPAPAPAVEKVISVAAAAPSPVAVASRQYHLGAIIGGAAAVIVRPIANYTSRLSPTVRQTIGYAAIITIFQAACLWGFLVFRGPPSEPAPTSEGAVLRHVGDDAEHAERMKAEAAHAKPASRATGKSDTKTAKKDSHGGH
ncbi:MAG: hypothetical protein KF869_00995 [Phycisphaeraceae bacterium]|nr:hypothetical protein [Phycisphaeraceae bacterium]